MRKSLIDIAQKWPDLAELCEHDGYNEALRLRRLKRLSAKNFEPYLSRPTACLGQDVTALILNSLAIFEMTVFGGNFRCPGDE